MHSPRKSRACAARREIKPRVEGGLRFRRLPVNDDEFPFASTYQPDFSAPDSLRRFNKPSLFSFASCPIEHLDGNKFPSSVFPTFTNKANANDSYPCLFTSIFLNRREMESNRVCGKFTVLLCQILSSSRCSTRNSETKNNLSVPRNKSHHKYHRACVCRIYSQPKTAKTSRRVEIRNLCLVSSSNRSC